MARIRSYALELFLRSTEEPFNGPAADEYSLPPGVFFHDRRYRVGKGFGVFRDPGAERPGRALDQLFRQPLPLAPPEESPGSRTGSILAPGSRLPPGRLR